MQELTLNIYRRTGWNPPVDVYKCAQGWLVKVELAGVNEQDIQINVTSNLLTIEGQRRDQSSPNIRELFSMEITYDWFKRSIQLPEDIDVNDIRTEYHDGMLLIHVNTRTEQ